jgi:hypothetical protein
MSAKEVITEIIESNEDTKEPLPKEVSWLRKVNAILKECKNIILTLAAIAMAIAAIQQSCSSMRKSNASYEILAKELNKIKDKLEPQPEEVFAPIKTESKVLAKKSTKAPAFIVLDSPAPAPAPVLKKLPETLDQAMAEQKPMPLLGL